MQRGLVPEGHRGNVVLQGQIAAAGAPAQGLDGDFHVLLKIEELSLWAI